MISNSRNVSEAQFSLIVCASKLDPEEVTKAVGLTPTKFIHNGEQLSKLPKIISHEDAWYHSVQLTNPEGSDQVLLDMLDRINNVKDYLNNIIRAGGKVTLRLALTTEMAFIGYKLNPDTISAIQKTGFPIDITTVSWGEIGF